MRQDLAFVKCAEPRVSPIAERGGGGEPAARGAPVRTHLADRLEAAQLVHDRPELLEVDVRAAGEPGDLELLPLLLAPQPQRLRRVRLAAAAAVAAARDVQEPGGRLGVLVHVRLGGEPERAVATQGGEVAGGLGRAVRHPLRALGGARGRAGGGRAQAHQGVRLPRGALLRAELAPPLVPALPAPPLLLLLRQLLVELIELLGSPAGRAAGRGARGGGRPLHGGGRRGEPAAGRLGAHLVPHHPAPLSICPLFIHGASPEGAGAGRRGVSPPPCPRAERARGRRGGAGARTSAFARVGGGGAYRTRTVPSASRPRRT